MHQKKSYVVILLLVFYSIVIVQTCKVVNVTTPEALVSKAHAIVRAKAVDYMKPPQNPAMYTNGIPDSIIRFQVEEVVKGNKNIISDPLLIQGYLNQFDDFNDGIPPYTFIRYNGRSGSCIANTYKQGAEFLLFLNKNFTPYWDALTPINEQLHLPAQNDKWLQWVKLQVINS